MSRDDDEFGGDTNVVEMPLRPPAAPAAVIHDPAPRAIAGESTQPYRHPPTRLVLELG